MRRLLAVAAALACVTAAYAIDDVSGTEAWGINNPVITPDEPVNGTGGGFGNLPAAPNSAYYNFRLLIDVASGNDWTAMSMYITLTNATFYQDAFGGDVPASPASFTSHPNLEYDSYFTAPLGWPNSNAGGYPSFAGPSWTPTTLSSDWFDTVNTDGGRYYLASITVIPDAGYETNWSGSVAGAYTLVLSGGYPWTYSFSIPLPEPASLPLLTLGGLALVRRR